MLSSLVFEALKRPRAKPARATLPASRRLQSIAKQYQGGGITSKQFESQVMAELTKLHWSNGAAARGGDAWLTPANRKLAEEGLKFQKTRLKRFVRQAAADENYRKSPAFMRRVGMYGKAPRLLYENVRRVDYQERGFTVGRRVRHASESCSICIAEAARGWVAINDMRALGDSICIVNCRCTQEFAMPADLDAFWAAVATGATDKIQEALGQQSGLGILAWQFAEIYDIAGDLGTLFSDVTDAPLDEWVTDQVEIKRLAEASMEQCELYGDFREAGDIVQRFLGSAWDMLETQGRVPAGSPHGGEFASGGTPSAGAKTVADLPWDDDGDFDTSRVKLTVDKTHKPARVTSQETARHVHVDGVFVGRIVTASTSAGGGNLRGERRGSNATSKRTIAWDADGKPVARRVGTKVFSEFPVQAGAVKALIRHHYGLPHDAKRNIMKESVLATLVEFNPYHDARGRFTSGHSAHSVNLATYRRNKSNQMDARKVLNHEPKAEPEKPKKPTSGAEARAAIAKRAAEIEAEAKKVDEGFSKLATDYKDVSAKYWSKENQALAQNDPARVALTKQYQEYNAQLTALHRQKDALRGKNEIIVNELLLGDLPAKRAKPFYDFSIEGKEKAVTKHLEKVERLAPSLFDNAKQSHIEFMYSDKRAHHEKGYFINIGDGKSKSITHEMGHWLENNVPGVMKAAQGFHASRTKGEPTTPMSAHKKQSGYGPDEVTKRDKFYDPYVGKIYRSGDTEILSMGIERMLHDPIGFAKQDPSHFDFVFNTVKGVS